MPQERGCSLHHKSKSDLFPVSPGRRRLGSQSFTPSRHRSHSRSSTPGSLTIGISPPHTSRKQPVAKPPRLMEVTPTQSPAQKTPKLKSLVQRAPAMKNYHDPRIIPSTKTPRSSSDTLWEIWTEKLTTWKSDAWLPSTHKPQS